MGTKSRRSRALIAGLVAVAGLIAGPLVAGASADNSHGGNANIRVTWTRTGNPSVPPVLGQQLCNTDNRCLLPVGGSSTLDGDLVGTADGMSVFGGNAPGLVGQAPSTVGAGVNLAVLTLNDSPCGSGTLLLMVTASGPIGESAAGTWQIVPRGGTGDLVNVTGTGHVTVAPDLSTSQFSGRVRCGQPPSST